MKLKTYTINDQGEVCEVSAFSRGLSMPEVQAATKGEAQKKLLLKAKGVLSNTPELYVSNGAFCLIHHNGEFFCADAGVIKDQGDEPKLQHGHCLSGNHPNVRHAIKNSSFLYYASEEYRNADKVTPVLCPQ